MPIKKSDLYASLWASCDELRGGMDASQYEDYVLFMLFIKYISDKCGNSDAFAPPVVIPKGASFTDMVALKCKPDIGDKINTQVIQPLIEANTRLARSDFTDFNDTNKLGEGQAMVDRAATWEMRTPFERWSFFFALVGCLAFGFAIPKSLRSPASDLVPLAIDQAHMRPLRFFAAVVFGLLNGWICALAAHGSVGVMEATSLMRLDAPQKTQQQDWLAGGAR